MPHYLIIPTDIKRSGLFLQLLITDQEFEMKKFQLELPRVGEGKKEMKENKTDDE